MTQYTVVRPKKAKKAFKYRANSDAYKQIKKKYRIRYPDKGWEVIDGVTLGKISRSLAIPPVYHLEFKQESGFTQIETIVDEIHVGQRLNENNLKAKDALLVASLFVPENAIFDDDDDFQIVEFVGKREEYRAMQRQSLRSVK